MRHFIGATLNGLKDRLNENNEITLLRREGDLRNAICDFNESASEEEVKTFEKRTGIELPSDYKEFLRIHNGADIFDSLYEGVNIGGGLHLYSLNEIEESLKKLTYLEEGYVPIAHLLEGSLLLIDQNILKKNQRNYLILFSGIEYKPLNLNFELFIDRLIMSQGENFWEWPIYTADNYYRLFQSNE